MNLECVSALETPYVLVLEERLEANILRLQTLANAVGLTVRPHGKTHKCVSIAKRQIDAGATGVTVSKADEAEIFMRAGIREITVAHPLLVESKFRRIIECAKETESRISFIVDSHDGLRCLASALRGNEVICGTFIKVDVGLHRCGIKPDIDAAYALASAIGDNKVLRFEGLLSHSGQAYGAQSIEQVAEIANQESCILKKLKVQLEARKVRVAKLSVGATPTVLSSTVKKETFEGLDELRPGNYVFFDRNAMRLGACSRDEVSLYVVSTIISQNDDYWIIDAGSKTLSSDAGAHGTAGSGGYGLASRLDIPQVSPDSIIVEKLSEEHGFIRKTPGLDLATGSRLAIIPNHSCPVANLAKKLVAVRGQIATNWEVDASLGNQ